MSVSQKTFSPVLDCSVCFEQYDSGPRLPKMLPCGHTFCLSCIKQHGARSKVHLLCPTCRTPANLSRKTPEWPTNRMVLDTLDIFADEQSMPCPTHNDQECLLVCIDCIKGLCIECVQSKDHKDHFMAHVDSCLTALMKKMKKEISIRKECFEQNMRDYYDTVKTTASLTESHILEASNNIIEVVQKWKQSQLDSLAKEKEEALSRGDIELVKMQTETDEVLDRVSRTVSLEHVSNKQLESILKQASIFRSLCDVPKLPEYSVSVNMLKKSMVNPVQILSKRVKDGDICDDVQGAQKSDQVTEKNYRAVKVEQSVVEATVNKDSKPDDDNPVGVLKMWLNKITDPERNTCFINVVHDVRSNNDAFICESDDLILNVNFINDSHYFVGKWENNVNDLSIFLSMWKCIKNQTCNQNRIAQCEEILLNFTNDVEIMKSLMPETL